MIFGNPVRGTITRDTSATGFRMTQDFGPTSLVAEPKVVWPGGDGIPAGTYAHFHKGIDLGNRRCGSDVLAANAGIVSVSYTTRAGENVIVLDHGSGWRTSYGHLASRAVQKGAKVSTGQKIGTVGATGNAFGCHLHFGVKSDVPAGANYYLSTVGKMRDPWPRLRQNVTAHLVDGAGVRIRDAATTVGDYYATTKADGHIYRRTDNADLGLARAERRWIGSTPGGAYVIGGVPGTSWERIEIDGATRFVASPLAVLSAR